MVFMMGGKYFMTLTTSDNLSDFFLIKIKNLIKTSLFLIRFLKLIRKEQTRDEKNHPSNHFKLS